MIFRDFLADRDRHGDVNIVTDDVACREIPARIQAEEKNQDRAADYIKEAREAPALDYQEIEGVPEEVEVRTEEECDPHNVDRIELAIAPLSDYLGQCAEHVTNAQ